MALGQRLGLNGKKYFQVVLIGFLAVQLVSWFISSVSDKPILKGGPMLFLFLIVILLVTLYSLGKNITSLDMKKDGLFILLVFGSVTILFLILPKIIPQIFAASGIEFGESIKRLVTVIMELSPAGIVPN